MTLENLYKVFAEKSLSVSIDTRSIQPGDIFFGIKGDTFDGNTFAIEALNKGASFVVSESRDMPMDDRCVLVEDSLKSLQEFRLSPSLDRMVRQLPKSSPGLCSIRNTKYVRVRQVSTIISAYLSLSSLSSRSIK